ncbi:PREDICTED: ciliogenesis-associated TTC17-interacting protein [Nanorana parkeri]|uniref:ciliogenesis-associated TTC17-interacting protein n=1 Tax=Nanorana parkeri TaxID=125878 RepID=UPI000854C62A|nr:PREDICTED: ciliogenesis-associated TTC17-interacting protein [Nanorana parkeri]
METLEPLKDLRASSEALEFLSRIGPSELDLCLFPESLQTASDSGTEVGDFTVSIQPAYYEQEGEEEEKCFLVHANSYGTIDGVPCGTSIVAYITPKLETLEQHLHEYVKFKARPLDKKTHMKRKGDKLVINIVIVEGQQRQQETSSHDLSSLSGFISEASNLLIMRLLARTKNTQRLDFLAFDAEMNLCISSYSELGSRPQVIGKDTVEVYGIERTIYSEDIPNTWQYYFLSDGHLASRVQVGSPVIVKLMEMPILSEPEEKDPKPVFEKKPLDWQDDVQLHSEFLDRKEELISDHETYLTRHPEMKVLLSDFMQFLLLRKPDDVFTFAAEFFAPFSSAAERGDTFRSSKVSNPFYNDTNETQ